MIKLLLVEDDVNLCYIVQAGLQDVIGGYEVITAGNGLEGLHAWEEHKPDIRSARLGGTQTGHHHIRYRHARNGRVRDGKAHP